MAANNQTIYRSNYRAYPYEITNTQLHFTLDPKKTLVKSKLTVKQREPVDMVLNGEDLELMSVQINGRSLHRDEYTLDEHTLTLHDLPPEFTLDIDSYCFPEKNTTLMGLYMSNHTFFTQCEAEGFRRITWYPDRPDVLSRFTVTLESSYNDYPIQLSNGNLISQRVLDDGRQQSVWEDPFPKPSYLFAIVAGKLAVREQTILTQSGRSVLLQVYSAAADVDKTAHAMESLIKSIRWDEQAFGLELDLDRFMIVATHDFNMGAMENKGLNIFNAAYVLADPDLSTDTNYADIEAVVGHEYFHNWTGNRVTCRDWFQLSLKEGLTVFRDQSFSADMLAQGLTEANAKDARAVKRIDDVMTLRAAQFPEDAGPMAHPIRPESYQEIGNFYTATVYEKGAEIIRMQHTLLGDQGFRQGMDEYIKRHDGQAVTCDDFVDAMESVYKQQHPTKDLSLFRRWYHQAGTPEVSVYTVYDAVEQTLKISLEQRCEPVGIELQIPGLTKRPFHIPFKIGFIDQNGSAIQATRTDTGRQAETHLLDLTMPYQSWIFTGIPSEPIPSLLRDFSAPIKVNYYYEDQELALLLAHDTNGFSRWEAGQIMASREIIQLYEAKLQQTHYTPNPIFVDALRGALSAKLDPGYTEKLLSLPSEKTLAESLEDLDSVMLYEARRDLLQYLGQQLQHELFEVMHACSLPNEPYRPDSISSGKRALKNMALLYLVAAQAPGAQEQAQQQVKQANNMTDRMGGMLALMQFAPKTASQSLMDDFYQSYQIHPTVIDKWFSLHACHPDTNVDTIQALIKHPAFNLKTPNRVRALLFQFCLNNPRQFNTEQGYELWVEYVLKLNQTNPEIAARFARILDRWTHYAPRIKEGMRNALLTVQASPTLSRNVAEVINKALEINHEA